MNANHFKQELLSLEEKLSESSKPNAQTPHHSARHLYFELQRLVHSYERVLIRAESTKLV
jgi:hypothetical protein